MTFQVRLMELGDVEGAVSLQRACFPAPFPEGLLWSAEHLDEHLRVFPEGQFVAVVSDEVVASASSLIISDENWRAHRNWDQTVGGPMLRSHDPGGSTLYGVDVSVHPGWRGQGVGRALYRARFDLVASLGLARYGTACRLPGFRESGMGSPNEYAEAVAGGRTTDRTMTPLLRYGLRYVGVIEGYMEDQESGNAAALLERSRRRGMR